jgi:hypothetical protein
LALGLFLAFRPGLLLSFRPGFLFLLRSSLLLALCIDRGQGPEQQRQYAQINESKRFHAVCLLGIDFVDPALGGQRANAGWKQLMCAFHASL